MIENVECYSRLNFFRRSDERDEELDDIFINRKNEGFVIINGDMLKLYSKRPRLMEGMILGQFVVSFLPVLAQV